MKVYAIWDTREQKAWRHKGKMYWSKPAHAKNAVLNQVSYKQGRPSNDFHESEIVDSELDRYGYLKSFKAQTRYECWEAEFDVNKIKKV